jgi:hypothetical protein
MNQLYGQFSCFTNNLELITVFYSDYNNFLFQPCRLVKKSQMYNWSRCGHYSFIKPWTISASCSMVLEILLICLHILLYPVQLSIPVWGLWAAENEVQSYAGLKTDSQWINFSVFLGIVILFQPCFREAHNIYTRWARLKWGRKKVNKSIGGPYMSTSFGGRNRTGC